MAETADRATNDCYLSAVMYSRYYCNNGRVGSDSHIFANQRYHSLSTTSTYASFFLIFRLDTFFFSFPVRFVLTYVTTLNRTAELTVADKQRLAAEVCLLIATSSIFVSFFFDTFS